MIRSQVALVALPSAADLSAFEGYFVEVSGANVAVCNNAADIPLGVLVDGEPVGGVNSVALSGAFPGIVTVKLGATPGSVVRGGYGTLNADGTVNLDSGSGARVRVCRFLEAGTAGELVEAILIDPVALS